ncbi:two-pore potassium channel 1-like [Pyrus ussuriensis x Pyrus communis]|uniref:Two-pore potassium channel 1-like n=1 Tax=Pyrus ussuriensis x Pyrus communis TaxID=2448454 RepID=A0A5N5FU52_9ROSA|nr:two-pore potassium channel 1-like [Pyrus ussuriensis x Pyrus communis]
MAEVERDKTLSEALAKSTKQPANFRNLSLRRARKSSQVHVPLLVGIVLVVAHAALRWTNKLLWMKKALRC